MSAGAIRRESRAVVYWMEPQRERELLVPVYLEAGLLTVKRWIFFERVEIGRQKLLFCAYTFGDLEVGYQDFQGFVGIRLDRECRVHGNFTYPFLKMTEM